MYTWGYIKENTLSKLNLTEDEAAQQNFLSRFRYYANEAMTQICSSVKPNEKYNFVYVDESDVGSEIRMPDDFVVFSDTPVYYKKDAVDRYTEVSDEFITHLGYNKISCEVAGYYKIPYSARWIFFTENTPDGAEIDAPADVCDALASYIASQCMKIDDEMKAAIFRNEYEIFLARMDDTSYRSQKSIHIGGGW